MIPRPLFNHAYLFEHFTDRFHASRGIPEVDRVAEGKLVAYPLADELAADGPLEDTLVEL